MSDVTTPEVRTTPSWLLVVVAIPFGLLYAYAVWNAIGTLVVASQSTFGLNAMGWFIWILSAVIPLVVFFLAFMIGRRRSIGVYALTLFAGLCVVAVFWIDVVAYTSYNAVRLVA